MKSRHAYLACAILCAGSVGVASAQTTARFPADPKQKQKVDPPKPAVAMTQTLAKGQFYVIASAQPLVVIPTGAGSVSVTQRKGPLMLPAELAIGWPADPNDPEFVTLKDEYLYVVKAVKSGAVDLQVIPALNGVDAKGKQLPLKLADIVNKKILVDAGEAPRPPPGPDVKPIDPPTPPDVKPATTFRVIMSYSSGQVLDQKQFSVLYGKTVEEYLTLRCTDGKSGWDRRPTNADDTLGPTVLKPMWAAARTKLTQPPCLVVEVDGVTTVYPLPADPASTITFLKTLARDK